MVISVFSAMPMGTPGAGVDPIVGYLKRNIVGNLPHPPPVGSVASNLGPFSGLSRRFTKILGSDLGRENDARDSTGGGCG